MNIWILRTIGNGLAVIGALLLLLAVNPLRVWRAPQGNFKRACTALLGVIMISIAFHPYQPVFSAVFVIVGSTLIIYAYIKTSINYY